MFPRFCSIHALILTTVTALTAQAGPPLRVCIVSGSEEYQSEVSMPLYKEYLEERYNIKVQILQAQGKESIPGLEALADCDTALFFTRRRTIDGSQLEAVKEYILGGRPVVAVRTASHGFQNFLEFDKDVLGGNYHGHFGGSAHEPLDAPTQRVELAEDAESHPLMKGISRIKSRYSLYKTNPVAEDATVLMWSEIPGEPKQAATWVREHNGGRVFYTALGGVRDFQNDTFKRLVAQALYWTARRDLEAHPLPDPPPMPAPSGAVLKLPLRTRVETFKGRDVWDEVTIPRELPASKTAILICDMWDKHWCQGATERVDALARKMDPVLKAAREKGVLILHCPSETLDFYADTPQRRRLQIAQQAPEPDTCALSDHPLPIDASDGGCDTEEKPWYMAWTQQHPAIEIGPYDGITDSGEEAYNFFAANGIENVLYMGVHTNMCVIGRSFGIRNMARKGLNCIIVRDLTDTMYDPKDPPYVSHDEGTELMVQHIEKYWGPSVSSEEIVRGLR